MAAIPDQFSNKRKNHDLSNPVSSKKLKQTSLFPFFTPQARKAADINLVSNASTLIDESPRPETTLKKCVTCKKIEWSRNRRGVLVVFDLNPKNDKKFAKCQNCKAYNDDITNCKVSQPTARATSPMTAPPIASKSHQLVADGGNEEEQCWLGFFLT